jgi:hypothetical protein
MSGWESRLVSGVRGRYIAPQARSARHGAGVRRSCGVGACVIRRTPATTSDTQRARDTWIEALAMLDELGHPHAESVRGNLAALATEPV